MNDQPANILILCTGNSARSILGEAILAELGKRRIQSFSARSKPKGEPHPGALRRLARKDITIKVCDNAAQESCPVFMGAPVNAYWGLPDPPMLKTVRRR